MTIIDMHVHLKHRSPCSQLTVNQLVRNLSNQIDGVCITDHNICYPDAALKNKGLYNAISDRLERIHEI